jgi:hypothetical protein
VASDLSKTTVHHSITQSVTFKAPKTKKVRTVLRQPPARGALKVLMQGAGAHLRGHAKHGEKHPKFAKNWRPDS